MKNVAHNTRIVAILKTQIKNYQTNFSSPKIPYGMQFYMGNPTVGEFHSKNKIPRHRRVPQFSNLISTNLSPTLTRETRLPPISQGLSTILYIPLRWQ